MRNQSLQTAWEVVRNDFPNRYVPHPYLIAIAQFMFCATFSGKIALHLRGWKCYSVNRRGDGYCGYNAPLQTLDMSARESKTKETIKNL